MDTIQPLTPAMTSEVFYDVTSPSYHHHHHNYSHHIAAGTSQDGYWPSGQRTICDLDRPVPSGVKCDVDVAPVSCNDSSDRKDGVIHAPTTHTPTTHTPTARKQSDQRDHETGRHKAAKAWKEEDEEKRRDSAPEVEDMTSPKENQVAATLKWLTENYELSDGVCLPRCVLYVHYLDFCKRQGFKPAGAATFGKLIRQKFKNITTRRLGTRGQSKYHYYGIGIIESSIYYQSVYTGKGLTRFSGIKIKTEGSSRKYSLSSKTGTLLPEFPSATNLMLPDEETTEKMTTFLMMYRTHSQRILDTVITANFEEIQNLLVHFWQGYPQHLQDVLRLPVTCDVVAICDSVLYTVLTDVLVPNAIQDLPESLSTDLRAFLKSLPHWLQNSLDDLIPETIRNVKHDVLQQFLRSMTRQVAFIKMAQTARPQLATLDVTTKALSDLEMIDFGQMCAQASFALNEKSLVNSEIVGHVFEELKSLLQKQSQIESYTEWIDSLVDKCVLQQDDSLPSKFKHRAGRFLLQWSMFGALVMKDLTLNNAQSFSFLHLMKMTLDEYVLLVMETQTDKLRDGQLQKNLQIHMKNTEEIKMSAKIRTQANKLLTSPKARKRKLEDQGESGDEIEPTVRSDESCTTFHTPPASASYYEPLSGTAFSRPLPLNQAPRDIPSVDSTPPVTSQCSDLLRPTTLNSNPLALSPMKHYPSYERGPYLPTPFGFNSYNDYVNHTSFGSQRQVQTFPDPPAPPAAAQPFHPMTFNSGVSSAPTPATAYWADARGHHSALADPYSQLGYGSYQQTYDTYKKSSLLRGSMYRDTLPRPAAASDGLSRTGATLDGLTRTNPLLDSLSRPPPSFDASRSAMYYARPSDNYQVGSSLAVGSYGNSFMEITPPSGQYHRQDGLFYQEDMFTPNMATASGLTGFSKSYLPAGFR